MHVVKEQSIIQSSHTDLYQYKCYVKDQPVCTSAQASYWYLRGNEVGCFSGDGSVFTGFEVCVEIFGYTPEKRTSTYSRGTDLPYINGCSSKNLIPPTRAGDPTWQMLNIPPNCQEQEHHIHSTARIVYVAEGSGLSIVGTPHTFVKHKLNKGDVLILPKMEPHHFKSYSDGLVVIPLHVFSSSENEFNHPMYNGTHRI